jgi:hypothetical protein
MERMEDIGVSGKRSELKEVWSWMALFIWLVWSSLSWRCSVCWACAKEKNNG